MKFSASTQFQSFAAAAGKVIQWRVYVRKISVLNTSLTSGTWTDASDYITTWPSAEQVLEYDIAQQSANSIELVGHDIAWWNANVFNATSSEYIELKLTAQVGATESQLAADVAIVFNGWVDKAVSYGERENTVEFSAYDAIEMLDQFDGVNATTQYVVNDADWIGSDGLLLHGIPGVYVANCNVSSYVLKVGIHKLTYDWNNGSRRLKLDDGAWSTISSPGSVTLVNDDGTQKVTVFVRSVTEMPQLTDTVTEKLVVTTAGNTLCRQYYRFIGAQRLLSLLYSKVGIDTVTFTTMNIPTYDGSSRVSYIELPPNDESVNGSRFAVTTDGTDLFMGIGRYLYKRTQSNGTYSQLADMGAGKSIYRLFYNARNGHIWIIYGSGEWVDDPADIDIDNMTMSLSARRYVISGGTLSAAATLTTPHHHTVALFDYNYTGASWKYGLFWCSGSTVKFLDGTDVTTVTTVTPANAPKNGMAYVSGANYFQQIKIGSFFYWQQTNCSSGGVLADFGTAYVDALVDGRIIYGAWVSGESRVYGWQQSTGLIRSQVVSTGTGVTVLTLDATDKVVTFYVNSGTIYLTTKNAGRLYSVASNTATLLDTYSGGFTQFDGITKIGSTIYGVNAQGLWQYGTVSWFFISNADAESQTLRQLMAKVVQAFNLVTTCSNKRAFVYRRGDASGTPETTGNTLTVTAREATNLKKDTLQIIKYDVVKINNGVDTTSYDGTTYDVDPSSTQRVLEIENALIPTNMLRDLVKYVFAFFNADRNLYEIELGALPLFQYEVFDAVSISYSGNISVSATGPMYGVAFDGEGNMTIKALL